MSGRVQTGCWCDGVLLFATSTEPIIYGAIVRNELVFTSQSPSSSNQALPIFDVSKVDLNGVVTGGLVRTLETDPKGQYLAVMFQDCDMIAVFNIITRPTLQLIPGYFVCIQIETQSINTLLQGSDWW